MKKCKWGLGFLLLSHAAFAAGSLPSLDDVRASMQAGNWQQAHDQLDRVLKAKPENALAHYLYAESAGHLGLGDSMCQHYQQAIQIDPAKKFVKKPDILSQMQGMCELEPKVINALKAEQWPLAEVLLGQLTQKQPENAQYQYWQAEALGHNGDQAGACAAYHRGVSLNGNPNAFLSPDISDRLTEACDNPSSPVPQNIEQSMSGIVDGMPYFFGVVIGIAGLLAFFNMFGESIGDYWDERKKCKAWVQSSKSTLEGYLPRIEMWLTEIEARLLDLRLAALDDVKVTLSLKRLESAKVAMHEQQSLVVLLLKQLKQGKKVSREQITSLSGVLDRMLSDGKVTSELVQAKQAVSEAKPVTPTHKMRAATGDKPSVVSRTIPATNYVSSTTGSSNSSSLLTAVAAGAMIEHVLSGSAHAEEIVTRASDVISSATDLLSGSDFGSDGSSWE